MHVALVIKRCLQGVQVEKVMKVLVLGLDGSGKSALVASMFGPKPVRDFEPTLGINVITHDLNPKAKIELWESTYASD